MENLFKKVPSKIYLSTVPPFSQIIDIDAGYLKISIFRDIRQFSEKKKKNCRAALHVDNFWDSLNQMMLFF